MTAGKSNNAQCSRIEECKREKMRKTISEDLNMVPHEQT